MSRPPRSFAAGIRLPPAGIRSLPRPRAQARHWRPFSPPSTRCSKRVVTAPLPDEVRIVYVSPLKALSADIHKNLAEPRAGIHRLAEEAGLRPPRITAAVRTGDTTQAGAGGDVADAAAHPRHDAGIAVSAPHGRPQPADAAHRAHGNRGRDPRGHRFAAWSAPRVDARAAGGRRRASTCSVSGYRRRRRRSRRSPDFSRPAMPRGCTIVDVGHRRRMDLGVELPRSTARRRDVERGLGGILRPPGGPHRGPSDDAGFREHTEVGGARRAAPQRTARRRCGDGASRQPVEGEAARRRNAAEMRTAEGARRDGVARARHRHRARRPRLPDRIAAPDRHAAAARRTLGPYDCRNPEGPGVPGVTRRSRRMRGAPAVDPVRSARRHRLARRAARRAGAADRRRVRMPRLLGRRSLCAGDARMAVSRPRRARHSTACCK